MHEEAPPPGSKRKSSSRDREEDSSERSAPPKKRQRSIMTYASRSCFGSQSRSRSRSRSRSESRKSQSLASVSPDPGPPPDSPALDSVPPGSPGRTAGVTQTEDGGLHFDNGDAFLAFLEKRAKEAQIKMQEAEALVREADTEKAAHNAELSAFRKRKLARAKRREMGSGSGSGSDAGSECSEDEDEDPGLPPSMPPSYARMKRMLAAPVTLHDEQRAIHDDYEGIRYIRVPETEEVETQVALGLPPQGKPTCFGCSQGGASVNAADLQKMATTWKRLRPYVRARDLALEMATYYEEYVRKPANDQLRAMRSRERIEVVTPAEILHHFEHHSNDPETYLVQAVEDYKRVRRKLLTNGVYVRNAANLGEEHVNLQALDALMKVDTMVLRLYAQTPSKMVGYAPTRSAISADHAPAFNPFITSKGMGPASKRRMLLSSANNG